VVLNSVVGAPRQQLGDVRPLVTILLLGFEDDAILLVAPGGLLDVWVEVVVPPLTTVLPNAAWQEGSTFGPFGWPP